MANTIGGRVCVAATTSAANATTDGTKVPNGVTVVVTNTADEEKEQVIELDAAQLRGKLGIGQQAGLRVFNKAGQEMQTQITHDGKLLVYVPVRPKTSASLRVEAGPSRYSGPVFVRGAYYPNRADDIAWENDRCAYRAYGPDLQRTGERAFGVDVWVKNTPELVVDQRYVMNNYGDALANAFRRAGRPAEADSVHRATSFHVDHGYGLDSYAVGPSLGCGTPALIENGQLRFPWCYKTYRILDNGPLRYTMELTYCTTAFAGDSITEHRIISLDRGSNFNRCEVWYEGLSHKAPLAMGVVVHKDVTQQLDLSPHAVLFADPTDRPDDYGTQVYVGVLLPGREGKAELMKNDDPKTAYIIGNAVVKTTIAPKEHVVFYFGAASSTYDVRTFAEWKLRAEGQLELINNPLTTIIK